MLTFYYSTGTCSTVTHIALKAAGLPFEGVEVSWQRKKNVEELAKVSSLGQVPVLVKDGSVLTQVAATLEFIADQVPEKSLLPKNGTWERAQANRWLAYISSDLQKAFGPFWTVSYMTQNTEAQSDIKKFALDNLQKQLAYVDNALEGKDFLLGKEHCLVDVYLFVVVGWCKYQNIKTSPFKNLHAFMKRMNEFSLVQKVLKEEGLTDYLPA